MLAVVRLDARSLENSTDYSHPEHGAARAVPADEPGGEVQGQAGDRLVLLARRRHAAGGGGLRRVRRWRSASAATRCVNLVLVGVWLVLAVAHRARAPEARARRRASDRPRDAASRGSSRSLAMLRCAPACRRRTRRSRRRAPKRCAREREEKAKDARRRPSPAVSSARCWSSRTGGSSSASSIRPKGSIPKIGNITPGSGFAIGPGYRHAGLLRRSRSTSARSPSASLKKYWMVDARLHAAASWPTGASFADVHGRRYDYPGGGLLRSRSGLAARGPRRPTACGARIVGGTAGRPAPWLTPAAASIPDIAALERR